jgi:hypothetical protein
MPPTKFLAIEQTHAVLSDGIAQYVFQAEDSRAFAVRPKRMVSQSEMHENRLPHQNLTPKVCLVSLLQSHDPPSGLCQIGGEQ